MLRSIAKLRFTTRILLAGIFFIACCFAAIASFVESNRRNWEREQSRMFDDYAVRWNERSYIPNLDIEHTCSIPEWIVAYLPIDNRDIFYRVTTLDISLGPAHAEDFERCTEFSHVDTIRLGDFYDTDRLVAAFALFPRLKRVELLWTDSDQSGRSMIDAMANALPAVNVVSKSNE